MRHYRREYSAGRVSVKVKRGKASWVASITEYTRRDAVDQSGHPIMLENGAPKVVTSKRALRMTIRGLQATEGSTAGVKKAEKALKEWRAELEAAAERDYQAALERDRKSRAFAYDSMLVPEFLELYFSELEADGRERSTIDSYTSSTARLRAMFADKPLGELTEEDLTAYDRKTRAAGVGNTARRKSLQILKSAIKAHRKHISADPFEGFKLPSADPSDPNALTAESLERLTRALDEAEPTAFMCAVEIALRTGMRVGEICALKWSDVDFGAGAIRVCRAIGRAKSGAACYVKTPKTANGARVVPMSPKIRATLERRLARMVADYMETGACGEEEASEAVCSRCYVVGDIDGRFASPASIGITWSGYAQGLTGTKGRRPTFHDLRHTYATYAIAHGVDPVTVASILGHADPSITMRVYADALPERKREAQAKMDAIF